MSVVDDVFDVKDQVALVTGGASGLGYAFASVLADAGACVVIADWDEVGLKKAVGSLAGSALAASDPPAAGRPGPPRRRSVSRPVARMAADGYLTPPRRTGCVTQERACQPPAAAPAPAHRHGRPPPAMPTVVR